MNKKIGFAVTGSFCTHDKTLEMMNELTKKGFDVLPIFSNSVQTTDTRFGKAKDFCGKVENICGKPVVKTLVQAEPIGPNGLIDLLVIAPCTGNTLSKLANGISDNAVTMVCKSHIRNNKPVVVGISTNDALGINMKNLATLLNTKNFYFIPFSQDNFSSKPKSLVANWNKLVPTIEKAFLNEQIQPLLD